MGVLGMSLAALSAPLWVPSSLQDGLEIDLNFIEIAQMAAEWARYPPVFQLTRYLFARSGPGDIEAPGSSIVEVGDGAAGSEFFAGEVDGGVGEPAPRVERAGAGQSAQQPRVRKKKGKKGKSGGVDATSDHDELLEEVLRQIRGGPSV